MTYNLLLCGVEAPKTFKMCMLKLISRWKAALVYREK